MRPVRYRQNQEVTSTAIWLRARLAPASRGPFLTTAAVSVAIAIAVALQLITVIGPSEGPIPFVAVAATVAGSVLAIRQPWPGLAIAALATVVAGLEGGQPIVEWSCAVFLLFAVVTRHGRPFVGALISAPPIAVGTALAAATGGPVEASIGAVISVAAGAAIGFGLRTQWQYRAVLEQRAEDAIATRELEADRRVAEERLRIARDLHDVIGHEVALVSMRLGVAEVSLPEEADEARAALADVRVNVRNVLTETQNILALLRAGESAPTEPTPDFTTLPNLLRSFREAGVDIVERIDVDPGRVDANSGLTAYRVLQEALTNAHRYGRGPVTVGCDIAESALRVEVRNLRQLGAHEREGGLGLVGMQERVTSAGGALSAGPDGAQFVVIASIPLHEGAST